MTIRVYGIPNCDSVKKARKWFADAAIEIEFIDFKKQPPTPALITTWVDAAGLDKVLNKRGTTWRKLSDAQKAISDPQTLIELMAEQPSLIKRPVIETDSALLVGFDADQLSNTFK